MHLPIHLDRGRDDPLQNQLFEQLRDLIVSGQLKPESRIIATRFLGEQLNVSRTTVLLAYERLIAEGYLETRPAVGTFVCQSLPGTAAAVAAPPPQPAAAAAAPRDSVVDFALAPDNRLFPYKSWLRITQTILDRQARRPLPIDHLPHESGIPALRSVLSEWLAFHRGIVASPEQIIVVAGLQLALAIAATLADAVQRPVVTEYPGDPQAAALFARFGGRRLDCPVDEHGLEVERLPDEPAALAYVTPSYQRPLGGMLPGDRRERLLDWAAANRTVLVEDDSDGDFRYQGSAQPSLFSLASPGRVIYLRRFSETLDVGLRLVYLVVPPALVSEARRIKASLDSGTPWLEQQVLAEFIGSGQYDRHLRMTRKTLLQRRDALIGSLTGSFGTVKLLGTAAGSRVNWVLPESLGTASLVRRRAAAAGVTLHSPPSQPPASGGQFTDRVLAMGYANLTVPDIKKGVDSLADALDMRRSA